MTGQTTARRGGILQGYFLEIGRRVLAKRAGEIGRELVAFVGIAADRAPPDRLAGRLPGGLRLDGGLVVGVGRGSGVGQNLHVIDSSDEKSMASQIDTLPYRSADITVGAGRDVVETVFAALTVRKTGKFVCRASGLKAEALEQTEIRGFA